MATAVILTVIGSDRPGLTQALADAVLAAGGNWLESHLARLGGKYVGSVLVELPPERLTELQSSVQAIDAEGLHVAIVGADQPAAVAGAPLRLDVVGQDRPGIVREVAAVLTGLGVNIESLETRRTSGSMSGETLFHAETLLALPGGVSEEDVREALERISGEIMVDFSVPPAAPAR